MLALIRPDKLLVLLEKLVQATCYSGVMPYKLAVVSKESQYLLCLLDVPRLLDILKSTDTIIINLDAIC